MIYALCALSLLCAVTLFRLISVKLQMRTVARELRRNLDPEYNRQVTVALTDRSLIQLTAEINRTLDNQRRLKRESVRAENVLRRSVSDIAHDLRTPMTVIKGNLQLLGQEEQLSPRGAEYLAVCREKADVLKEMADMFFELSVLESGDSAAEIRKVNLTKTLMQFFADSEAAIRLKGLQPEIRFPEKTLYILADEQMLLRMLGNVLNNLLKYAEAAFTVTAAQEQERCSISFSNPVRHGEMPDTAQMFTRNYRADASRSGGGAGLGLFIVQLLAEKQDAEVRAFSEGDTLTLELFFKSAV